MLPEFHFSLEQTTPPTAYPVASSDFKLHARIDSTDDDNMLSRCIGAATEYVEQQTGRQLMQATWKMYFDDFPAYGNGYCVPFGKLSTSVTIEYFDENGTSQTLASTKYWVDDKSTLGGVSLRSGETWPQVHDDRSNAVVTTFTCGYGTGSSSVPEALKSAIDLVASNLYENREPVVVGSISKELELTVDSMIRTKRIEAIR